MNLKNARFADDPRPIDDGSSAYAARKFSRAYLRHLVKSGEILGMMALTAINLAYFQELMAGARAAIEAGQFADFASAAREGWKCGENEGA
jgi:queuine tRNA-ribosyltransferase